MIKSNRSKTRRDKQLGQGMTEYIIIVSLVAIVGIVAVKAYGSEVDVAIQGSGPQATNTVNAAIDGVGTNGSEEDSRGRGRGLFGRVRDNVEREATRGRANGGLTDNPILTNENPDLGRDNRDAFGRFAETLGN